MQGVKVVWYALALLNSTVYYKLIVMSSRHPRHSMVNTTRAPVCNEHDPPSVNTALDDTLSYISMKGLDPLDLHLGLMDYTFASFEMEPLSWLSNCFWFTRELFCKNV